MREPDEIYFKRRAMEERLAAERAAHASAQRAHLDLSELYEDAANERRTTVSVVSFAERPAVTPLGVSR
jgi:hypothetical protein